MGKGSTRSMCGPISSPPASSASGSQRRSPRWTRWRWDLDGVAVVWPVGGGEWRMPSARFAFWMQTAVFRGP